MGTNREKTSGRKDTRELPCYSIPEAAHYLRLPTTTLRAWLLGQAYAYGGRRGRYKSLIRIADPRTHTLSFMNLVEAHVLKAMRRHHEISMQKVRKALTWLSERYPSNHPLADNDFATNGVDVFVEKYGSLIQLGEAPQIAMRDILRLYLTRIERDVAGLPVKLYPFTHREERGDPGLIEVNPEVCFGRSVLRGTSVPSSVIAERYKAGESIRELARDYERKETEIEEALRCEFNLQAAA